MARAYDADVIASRWRCAEGEIDLILESADHLIFCEVKMAPTHDQAAARITPQQARRVMVAAQVFCDLHPHHAQKMPRYDAALVDQSGQIAMLENALADFVMI